MRPSPRENETVNEPSRRRGTLRVYLGAAPGVGKTFAMLDEGKRRAERGADVVVGIVETHGRAGTARQVAGLEVLPRRESMAGGIRIDDLDLAALLKRAPDVALVDELAHTTRLGPRMPSAGRMSKPCSTRESMW